MFFALNSEGVCVAAHRDVVVVAGCVRNWQHQAEGGSCTLYRVVGRDLVSIREL